MKTQIIKSSRVRKIYTVEKTRRGITKEHTGTLSELNSMFSYTLELGNAHNSRVLTNPKTVKSLITNLNRVHDGTADGYKRTQYELVA